MSHQRKYCEIKYAIVSGIAICVLHNSSPISITTEARSAETCSATYDMPDGGARVLVADEGRSASRLLARVRCRSARVTVGAGSSACVAEGHTGARVDVVACLRVQSSAAREGAAERVAALRRLAAVQVARRVRERLVVAGALGGGRVTMVRTRVYHVGRAATSIQQDESRRTATRHTLFGPLPPAALNCACESKAGQRQHHLNGLVRNWGAQPLTQHDKRTSQVVSFLQTTSSGWLLMTPSAPQLKVVEPLT
jgi:hypothetical protein